MMTETQASPLTEQDAPLEGATRGLLRVRGGVTHGTIRAMIDAASTYRDDGGGRLYRARFHGPVPHVTASEGRVEIDQRWRGWLPFSFGTSMDVELSREVRWELELTGGLSNASLTLSSVRVDRFELTGGAGDLRFELGAPDRAVPVILRGGASDVTIVRPRGVPVRLSIGGGASHVAVDEQRFEAVGSGLVLTSRGFGEREARYEIEIRGGASEITVREA